MNVGSVLRDLREDSGLTIAQISAKAGVSPSSLLYYETEDRALSLERLFQLADAYEVAPGYLLSVMQARVSA